MWTLLKTSYLQLDEVCWYFKSHSDMQSFTLMDNASDWSVGDYRTAMRGLQQMYNYQFNNHPHPRSEEPDGPAAVLTPWLSDYNNVTREKLPYKDTGEFLANGVPEERMKFKLAHHKRRVFRRKVPGTREQAYINLGFQNPNNAAGDGTSAVPAVYGYTRHIKAGLKRKFHGKEFTYRQNSDTLPRGCYVYCQYWRWVIPNARPDEDDTTWDKLAPVVSRPGGGDSFQLPTRPIKPYIMSLSTQFQSR